MNPVRITMKVSYDGQEAELQTMSGVRHERDGKIYLQFMQTISTEGASTPTLLIVENSTVRVHRKGDYASDFLFDIDNRHPVTYNTPMGALPMETDTRQLDLFISDEILKIKMRYNLMSNDQIMTAVDMIIHAVVEQHI